MLKLNLALPKPAGISSAALQTAFAATTKKLKPKINGVINLSFVNRKTSRHLNKTYAGNDYPTDVLSFNYLEDKDNFTGLEIADIVICTPIAADQATDNKISLEQEIILLEVHGLLHILGYDHQTKGQAASLDRLQSDIMESLDYAYHPMQWLH